MERDPCLRLARRGGGGAGAEESPRRSARAEPREIVFTSGATESDNSRSQGMLRAPAGERDQLVTRAIEHPAVLDTAARSAARASRVTQLPVRRATGLVDPAAVARALGDAHGRSSP